MDMKIVSLSFLLMIFNSFGQTEACSNYTCDSLAVAAILAVDKSLLYIQECSRHEMSPQTTMMKALEKIRFHATNARDIIRANNDGKSPAEGY